MIWAGFRLDLFRSTLLFVKIESDKHSGWRNLIVIQVILGKSLVTRGKNTTLGRESLPHIGL